MTRTWLALFIAAYFSLSFVACFAEEKRISITDEHSRSIPSRSEIEISAFAERADAERLSEKTKNSGFDTVIRMYENKDGRTVYGVFINVNPEQPEGSVKTPSAAVNGRTELMTPPGEGRPDGASATWNDLFPRWGGYVHASLEVTGIYTDNAFYTRTDKKSDFSMMISPEVWLSVPRASQKPTGLDPIATRSPGGLLLGRDKVEGSRRFNAFLLFRSDIPQYSKNSPSGNTTTYTVQGGLAYSFPFGLSLAVNNEFARSYEILNAVSVPGEVDRFKSNLVYAIASFDTGNRLYVRLDYSYFLLRYDAERNAWKNRDDNSLSGYLFYRVRPKTSLFVQYTFTDIRYEDDAVHNNKEYNLFGGIQWDMTAKTSSIIKAGWGTKDFGYYMTRNFIFEAQLAHQFSRKSSLTLSAFRKTDETYLRGTVYTLLQGFRINYQQMLTYKLTGSLDLAYSNERFRSLPTLGDVAGNRKDNIYQATLSLQYEFRRWLKPGIDYIFTARESNFPENNYTSNTIMIRLTGSL